MAIYDHSEKDGAHKRHRASDYGNPIRMDAKELGRFGEALAFDYLVDKGWEILETNWVCKAGEADIIALDDDDNIVFIEVKTRRAKMQDLPELAVDCAKRKKYEKIAHHYLLKEIKTFDEEDIGVRFDIIAIYVANRNEGHLRHVFNAYGSDE